MPWAQALEPHRTNLGCGLGWLDLTGGEQEIAQDVAAS